MPLHPTHQAPVAPRLDRRSFLRGGAMIGGALIAGNALSGCASTSAPGGARTVTLWSWLTGMNKYVAAFNASQTEVHVELSVIASGLSGGYAQQTNAIRAHNAPDILHVEYQGLPQILTSGGLRDITAEVADLESGYSPAAWRGVRPDGRTWAIPMDLAPQAFYYRKDLFDKHGIEVPTTWDQFGVAARAVRTAAPDARIASFPLNDGSFFAGMCWGAGDPWWRVADSRWQVNIASDGSMRTARFWQQMISDDLVRTIATSGQEWSAAMHEGRLWGLLGAAWSVGTFKKTVPDDKGRWAVAPMPVFDRATPTNGVQGGTAFGISRESRNHQAALTFLRWLSTNPKVPAIGATFTSPFSAYIPNRTIARAAYKGGFFIGDPVYDVLDTAAERVPDWTWGPNALAVFSTVVDKIGATAGDLPGAVQQIQSATVADMRKRGLAVVEGTRS
ncbi:ABC transporter substrate-binding protein [Williamsia sp. CHRR-6]|uniref:ABC transporter substrate-binding protein n=1 Tax=Williamsia sp. CHRR-6 TaxID=2835871 RepID=UPI001BDABD8A|nr:extracellular solute-binding protein [Williamsia sp. CHRR-6]MBT0567068.1 extracellular solute-binding protein [Williamsia sp. CHRR-6]